MDSTANLTTADQCAGMVWTPITLPAGSYIGAISFSGNTTLPNVALIEDYSSYSSVFDSLRDFDPFGHPWGVYDNGAGGWTTSKDMCPGICIYVDDFPYARNPVAFFA